MMKLGIDLYPNRLGARMAELLASKGIGLYLELLKQPLKTPPKVLVEWSPGRPRSRLAGDKIIGTPHKMSALSAQNILIINTFLNYFYLKAFII